MVLIPKIQCQRPGLDMSLMADTLINHSIVQDIIVNLPRLLQWPSNIVIVNHHVRRSRAHLDLVPKTYMYNMIISVIDEHVKHSALDSLAEEIINVEDIVVDVLWCGTDRVQILYVAKERDAWSTPVAFNDNAFCTHALPR